MKTLSSFIILAAITTVASADEIQLFNGKDLTGWEGNSDFWSVQDGVITGRSTVEKPVKTNTFLIWKGGEVSDFELTVKLKLLDAKGEAQGFGNTGIQYRSKIVDPKNWVVAGYQADFEIGKAHSGILYEEKGRGILAKRGEKTVIREGDDAKKPKIEVAGSLGDEKELLAVIKPGEWNEYRIVAQGKHLQQFLNGRQTVDVVDETSAAATTGVLAIQIHQGQPMTVQVKDIVLKR